jgi:hypothetical protein
LIDLFLIASPLGSWARVAVLSRGDESPVKSARGFHRRFTGGAYNGRDTLAIRRRCPMKARINRRTVAIAATIGALAAGGAGIAYAVSGDDEEQVTGPDASRAEAAALEAVGGGTVT